VPVRLGTLTGVKEVAEPDTHKLGPPTPHTGRAGGPANDPGCLPHEGDMGVIPSPAGGMLGEWGSKGIDMSRVLWRFAW
jgi:hypothetical protein